MEASGIKTGFGFLGSTAGYDVLMSLIPFSATDSYFKYRLGIHIGYLFRNHIRFCFRGNVLLAKLVTKKNIDYLCRNIP